MGWEFWRLKRLLKSQMELKTWTSDDEGKDQSGMWRCDVKTGIWQTIEEAGLPPPRNSWG